MYLEILQAKRKQNANKTIQNETLSNLALAFNFHVFVLFVRVLLSLSCLFERLLKGWDPHQEGDNNCEEQSLQSVKQYC